MQWVSSRSQSYTALSS